MPFSLESGTRPNAGAFITRQDAAAAAKIRGQLNMSTRAMISNPPLHGARLVAAVPPPPFQLSYERGTPAITRSLQGYLAHKKLQPLRSLQ